MKPEDPPFPVKAADKKIVLDKLPQLIADHVVMADIFRQGQGNVPQQGKKLKRVLHIRRDAVKNFLQKIIPDRPLAEDLPDGRFDFPGSFTLQGMADHDQPHGPAIRRLL